jgi:outer membrane protein assembly factor BamD (BamD/ComL family)
MLNNPLRGVVVAVVIGACAFAQRELIAPGTGSDVNQGVYVHDSARALELFANGQKMERLKEWTKAADFYQEVIEKFADSVVQSDVDQDNNVIQYKSVTIAVQERLTKWPDEGLAVYKARFEPVAAGILEQAGRGDNAALQKIFSLYFTTESGKQAGLRLIDLYLESGEFAAAARIGERLLAVHPTIEAQRPMVLFRTALAAASVGR